MVTKFIFIKECPHCGEKFQYVGNDEYKDYCSEECFRADLIGHEEYIEDDEDE